MPTSRPEAEALARARPDECFHCALPVPRGTAFAYEAGGERRRFCCAGCEAVSRAIHDGGLDDYYRLRQASAERPVAEEALPALALYDDPLVQSRFVREAAGGLREADLLLEGLRCAACGWLIESRLAAVPGIRRVRVNSALRRAHLEWDPREVRLSEALAAVASVGYRAWPGEEGRRAWIEGRERRSLLLRLLVAGLGMMQVMMYAFPAYVAGEGEITADIAQLMRWAGLVLTLPVLLYSAAPYFAGAWRDLRMARLGMDLPVALGLGVAFAASAAATIAGEGAVYFDSVAMFVFLLTGGRYLELLARRAAARALDPLSRLIPETAHRLRREGDLAHDTVPVAALGAGDRVLVRPGERVPADGELEDGEAIVSEALLHGESRPARKARGAAMVGGAVNAGSAFTMRVVRVGSDTVLSSIVRLMERALSERPPWTERAERAAAFFVAAILAAAVAAGVAWTWIDPARALWIAVSVLIVTCPCALSLATPAVLAVATGEAARRNLVIARGRAIEALADATDFVFDKTGTVTNGEPRILQVVAWGALGERDCVQLAAAMAQGSAHPLDRALAREAMPGNRWILESHRSVPGEGAEAVVSGSRYRIGRAEFAGALHRAAAPIAWLHERDTTVWLASDAGWLAAFRMGDAVRPEAQAAIVSLQAMGKRTHLLSGDDPAVTARVAKALGIRSSEARATPRRKLAFVRALQRRGARVAMVGDGINDAPVLAQADLSIAMGGGADLARTRADAVLVSDSLADLASAVALARRARRIVRQNIAWGLGYNLVVLPLAFAGMVTPLVAGIGMSASSALVLANALRLRSALGPLSGPVARKSNSTLGR